MNSRRLEREEIPCDPKADDDHKSEIDRVEPKKFPTDGLHPCSTKRTVLQQES